MSEPRVMVTTNILMSDWLMQVCAVEDASDAEILEVCNRERPLKSHRGGRSQWMTVYRTPQNDFHNPIVCEEHPGRLHFLVGR